LVHRTSRQWGCVRCRMVLYAGPMILVGSAQAIFSVPPPPSRWPSEYRLVPSCVVNKRPSPPSQDPENGSRILSFLWYLSVYPHEPHSGKMKQTRGRGEAMSGDSSGKVCSIQYSCCYAGNVCCTIKLAQMIRNRNKLVRQCR